MCGRFKILYLDEVLELLRQIEAGTLFESRRDAFDHTLNAYPKSVAPLIVPTFDTAKDRGAAFAQNLAARELTWGFEESWKPGVIFNTRIESAMKPTWRDSIEHRRCIVPTPAFYETNHNETVISSKTGREIKRQYEFQSPDTPIMLIGCIWRGDCFSMVTTDANADMAPIHHRMPLIIRQEELPTWFSSDFMSLANRSNIPLESHPA